MIWTTLFDHALDFSKTYNKLVGVITAINVLLLVFSYIHSSLMHPLTYDMLLRALIICELGDLNLECGGVGDVS